MQLNKKVIIIISLIFIFNNYRTIANDTLYTLNKGNVYAPVISIVLSGGGARAITHIGALKSLEDNNIKFSCIAGTSMGAIIGGIYASGYSTLQLDSIFKNINWRDIVSDKSKFRQNLDYFDKLLEDRSILSLYFDKFKLTFPEGISSGYRLNNLLYDLLFNTLYYKNDQQDSMKYDFIAVATDLVSAKSVILKDGSLIQNLRASSAVPINYVPIKKDTMILIDGGILANLPVRIAKQEFNPDIIIAFNVSSPIYSYNEIDNPIKIIDQALSINMNRSISMDEKAADILISPDTLKYKNIDYYAVDSLINIGYNVTEENIYKINNKINGKLDSFLLSSNLSSFIDSELFFYNFNLEDSIVINNLENNNEKLKLLNSYIINGKYKEFKFVGDIKCDIFAIKYKGLKNINITGYYSNFIEETINNILETLIDKPLNDSLCLIIKEKILFEYKQRNIPYIDIHSKVEQDTILNINIIESILRNIIVVGNSNVSTKSIINELNIKTNELIYSYNLFRGYNNLLSLNLFSEINFNVEQLPNGCNLIVSVKERGIQNLRITGQSDNERNFIFGLDLINANIFDLLVKDIFHFHTSFVKKYVSNTLIIPRILGTDAATIFNLYYDWEQKNIFKKYIENNNYKVNIIGADVFEKIGLEALVGFQVQKNGILGIAYRFEKQNIKEYKNNYYKSNLLSTIKLNFDYDSEDDNYFTSEGGKVSMSLETNFFTPNNNPMFSKIKIYIRNIWRYKDIYIRPSFSFLVGDRTMPYIEFFSLGGQYNFFGYRENEEMGRQLFKTSLDIKRQLSKTFSLLSMDTYLGIRYDLGAVWINPESIKFSTLKHGIGFSLMLDTPIGPAGFSIGKMFNFIKNNNISKVMLGPTLLYFTIGASL